MRYMASIYVSDVMDQVALTLEIQAWEGQFGPPETVCQKTLVWPGIGEGDAIEWVARALFLASSDLTTPRREGSRRGAAMGGPHTLSESRDNRPNVMG